MEVLPNRASVRRSLSFLGSNSPLRFDINFLYAAADKSQRVTNSRSHLFAGTGNLSKQGAQALGRSLPSSCELPLAVTDSPTVNVPPTVFSLRTEIAVLPRESGGNTEPRCLFGTRRDDRMESR